MNTDGIETELKYRLSDWRAIHRLVEALPPPEAHFTQTNNYLDDPKRSLREAKVMLRAREITFPVGAAKGLGKPPVTITGKRRKSALNGLFVSEEREQVMAYDDWRDVELGREPLDTTGAVFRWVASLAPGLGKLRVIGQTVNHRWQIESDLFMLELDKTVFPDGSIEGEIECETLMPEEARAHILELAAKVKVEIKPATQGKYARFLEKAEGYAGYTE